MLGETLYGYRPPTLRVTNSGRWMFNICGLPPWCFSSSYSVRRPQWVGALARPRALHLQSTNPYEAVIVFSCGRRV